jgi:uncharacterized protein YjbJ (UPF0337 family)
MEMEEIDGQWDRLGKTAPAKWGNLTRTERTRLSGRRHSHQLKLYELYGISEEDAERALADVEPNRGELLPQDAQKT